MTQSLSWNLHGNDQLSSLLEKLDRTIGQLSRRMNSAAGDARAYGRAIGDVDVPTRRFTSSADKVKGHLDDITAKVGTAIATIGRFGAAAAIGLGAAAVAATTAAGAFGLKMAAANEDAAISFELMLGNAEKAQAFLQKLLTFSAATPFEMPQLRSAASRLLAVGTAAEHIIPILTVLGDATAGMGTGAFGIERAVTALTQMRQKTKVTGEEMMQLTEAGIPAWETLAAKLNVDVATAMEKVTKREVDSGVIFAAIEERKGAALQRLTGMMDRQSRTLNGMWSTFKDNAGQALAGFVEPMLPGIKNMLNFAATAIPKVLGFITNFRQSIADIFKDSEVPGQIMASLKETGQKILPQLKAAFEMIVVTVKENKDGLEKLGRFLADVVIPAGGKLIVTLTWIAAGFISLVTAIMARVVPALQFFTDKTLDFFGMIVHGAAAALGWAPGFGQTLKDNAEKFDVWAAKIRKGLDELNGKTVNVNVKTNILYGYQSFGAAPSNVVPHGANIPQYAEGGMVPGPMGKPMLAVVHGGEEVRTPSQQGSDGGILGYLVVKHEYPDANRNREDLLALKRRKGLTSLGLA